MTQDELKQAVAQAAADYVAKNAPSGAVIGSPSYLSPEQVRGQGEVTASADIFSLGCVLFECLVGQPPFVAENTTALLAKILFDDAPPLSQLLAAIPEPLEALVLAMLAKDPAARPADAEVLLGALAALGPLQGGPAQRLAPRETSLTAEEQRLVSVVVMLRDDPRTAASPQDEERIFELQRELGAWGAQAEQLADGTFFVTLTQQRGGTPTDQAESAARCALLLHRSFPDGAVALAAAISCGGIVYAANNSVQGAVKKEEGGFDGDLGGLFVADFADDFFENVLHRHHARRTDHEPGPGGRCRSRDAAGRRAFQRLQQRAEGGRERQAPQGEAIGAVDGPRQRRCGGRRRRGLVGLQLELAGPVVGHHLARGIERRPWHQHPHTGDRRPHQQLHLGQMGVGHRSRMIGARNPISDLIRTQR